MQLVKINARYIDHFRKSYTAYHFYLFPSSERYQLNGYSLFLLSTLLVGLTSCFYLFLRICMQRLR